MKFKGKSIGTVLDKLSIEEISDVDQYLMDKDDILFISSLDLSKHPMRNVKHTIRIKYYNVIEYFVLQQSKERYVYAKLGQYKKVLFGEKLEIINELNIEDDIKAILNCPSKPWRKKYRYGVLCDMALILLKEEKVNNIFCEVGKYLSKNQLNPIITLKKVLNSPNSDLTPYNWAESIIRQFWNNNAFLNDKELRIIVSATMSAGKSTLVNALIGKRVAKTAQEVCTGNISFINNKPYEDNVLYLDNGTFHINPSLDELVKFSWDVKSRVASFFRFINPVSKRICLIDTPGVNSAINRKHGKITKEILTTEKYDKVIYVLNANKLGTEEELSYLKWFAENVQRNKVVFVLNKIDDFNAVEDNIDESIEGVKKDLNALNFENPIICPMSAYCSLLIKMKLNGDKMSEDEEDEYNLYIKKFNKPAYDLSSYYNGVVVEKTDDEMMSLSKKCGLYGLEKIILGDTV